jgi:hypothetical protein
MQFYYCSFEEFCVNIFQSLDRQRLNVSWLCLWWRDVSSMKFPNFPGTKENGCFDRSLCVQKKAEKTPSFNPYHAPTSTVSSVLTMPNMVAT